MAHSPSAQTFNEGKSLRHFENSRNVEVLRFLKSAKRLERLELTPDSIRGLEHLERLPLQRLLTCLLMGDPGDFVITVLAFIASSCRAHVRQTV
jgi:hypothetical protein